jgi:hypothetical protein
MWFDQINDVLINETGFDGFMHLDDEDSRVLTEAFRQDAMGAARHL